MEHLVGYITKSGWGVFSFLFLVVKPKSHACIQGIISKISKTNLSIQTNNLALLPPPCKHYQEIFK